MATTAWQEFEQLIERTFEPYLKAMKARLYRMPPKVVPTHHRDKNGMPYFRLAGKGPFDVIGHSINPYSANSAAVYIGAEIKLTTKPAASLPIIIPPVDGAGLEFHQLEALVTVAMSGGIARVVWSNGGQVLVLKEPGIIIAFTTVMDAMASIVAKKDVRPGTKSIKADQFKPVVTRLINGVPIYDWLDIQIE